ncbi:Phosphoenolpyruvate synthase [subsurface metagenome]
MIELKYIMKAKFIKPFRDLSKKDISIAGGKGASLGEMTQAGLSIPPGFVVLATAFDEFLKQTDLNIEIDSIIKKVNHKDINSVEGASVKIRDLINDKLMPENIKKEIQKEFNKLRARYVAVRSSATAEDSSIASWAGELESYLNVTKKDLLGLVKKCWSSLFTPRAIFYRFEKKLNNQKISVAVVIQKMVQSEVSGVCFTVHPITEDRNQMVIEAGYGLGEAIVGGKITPDTYVINKKLNSILDINISKQKMMITKTSKGTMEIKVLASKQEKQKLTNKQIVQLAKICKKIEEHYKSPQDIEWAIENNKIHITQSRPITTL